MFKLQKQAVMVSVDAAVAAVVAVAAMATMVAVDAMAAVSTQKLLSEPCCILCLLRTNFYFTLKPQAKTMR